MSYDAAIWAHPSSDAIPLWELLDAPSVMAAFVAAEDHIRATQPTDRLIVDTTRPGEHQWRIVSPQGQVATLTITDSS